MGYLMPKFDTNNLQSYIVKVISLMGYQLRQLHKNVASNIEQVMVATLHKAPTIRPPAFHHENYPS